MAILAVLASAAACSRGSDEPSLVGAEDAFEVQAFEAGALEFSAEGIAQIVFADRSMAIRKLSFEVRGRPNGARVEVARLEARPNVPFPPGEVFQYIEVAAEGFDDLEVRSVTLSFAVPNQWLDDDLRDAATVTLVRLSDGWQRLTTWITDRSGDETGFQAVSPGLSLFAIVASAPTVVLAPGTPSGREPAQTSLTPTASPAQAIPASKTSTSTPVPPDDTPTPATAPATTATPTRSPTATPTLTAPSDAPPTPAATAVLTPTPTHVPIPEGSSAPTPVATPSATAVPNPPPPPPGPPPPPAPLPTSTAIPAPTPTPKPIAYDDRFGIVLHSRTTSDNTYFLEQLGISWYLDLESDMSQVPAGASKVGYVRVPSGASAWVTGAFDSVNEMSNDDLAALGMPTETELEQMAAASPGTAWYLFGEPNKYGYITGDRFAPVFRHLSTHIKLGDPTATIVSPSILNWEWTCYQLCYYEPGKNWIAAFIATYETEYGEKPPVDAWAIDAYPIDWVRTPNTGAVHAPIAIDQISGLSDYPAAIPEYQDTPIWITEIALHVGYDGWTQDSGNFVPVGVYHWDAMSDYIVEVLDWLEANASDKNIERWFFYKSWRDVSNASTDGFMGITFFDDPEVGALPNCLGETYRSRALGLTHVTCDAAGNTVPLN